MKTKESILLLSFLFSANLLGGRQASISIDLISTFDYPGSKYLLSYTQQIANNGDIVGDVYTGNYHFAGFARAPKGRFSRPFVDPNSVPGQTYATGINQFGLVCGYYYGPETYHGFFLSAGVFTTYDLPGANGVFLMAVNDAGHLAGFTYSDPENGFLASNGVVTTFSVPGSFGTQAVGLNGEDMIVGAYLNDQFVYHAFLREPDGTFRVALDYPGATSSHLEAINDTETMVGYWEDSSQVLHGYLVKLPNTFLSFDVPGASETSLSGINNSGRIVGTYQDTANLSHGFLARVRGH